MIDYAPGMRIIARGEEWIVKRVETNSLGNQTLQVVGISSLVKDYESRFMTDIEKGIEIVDPAKVKLVPDDSSFFKKSKLYIESHLRQKIPTDNKIHVGDKAAMDLIETIYELYFSMDDMDEEEDEPVGGFFKGAGQYFFSKGKPLSDDVVGKEILYRKIRRMKEKMQDPDNYYTFDVLEEYIFVTLIETAGAEFFSVLDHLGGHEGEREIRDFIVDDSVRWLTMTTEEKKTAGELQRQFDYSREDAEQTALQIHRIHEMLPDDDEDDNMFFWDMDMEFLFKDGFVSGIKRCAGAEGTFLGYGYEYTEEIFTDIGMKPPIQLLGTKEASQASYDAMNEAIRRWDYGKKEDQ